MPDASTAIASLYERARELARQGYGYEDLVFKLGKEGLTKQAAKIIVLGKKREPKP